MSRIAVKLLLLMEIMDLVLARVEHALWKENYKPGLGSLALCSTFQIYSDQLIDDFCFNVIFL